MFRIQSAHARAIRLWRRLLVLAASMVAVVLASAPAVRAAAPLDHRSLNPNDSSEIAGSGFLLSDPAHRVSGAYWAGAYGSVRGRKAYCVDEFYDYPRAGYGYQSREVGSWPGRAGSNGGASGRTAQRISWIVNSYGESPNPAVDAAVALSINRLIGSPVFEHSYQRYFLPQLRLIDPGLPALIERMISDSEMFAGPYQTRVTFAAAPGIGGVGQFTVTVRSATGYPLRGAATSILKIDGGELSSPSSAVADAAGSARFSYRALPATAVKVVARGAAPANTLLLGYSPSHSGTTFSSGSQRVVMRSSAPSVWTAAAEGSLLLSPPRISTAVVGGTGARGLGTQVIDAVTVTGLAPGIPFTVRARLQDSAGRVCGEWRDVVGGDRLGNAELTTGGLSVCGSGKNTYVEELVDAHGRVVVVTPPGQPGETFAVSSAPAAQPPRPVITPPMRTAPRVSQPARSVAPRAVAQTSAVVVQQPVSAAHPAPARAPLAVTGASITSLATAAALTVLGGTLVLLARRRR